MTVGASGTSGGFEKFCAGETDISDASRPIEPEEEKLCEEGGVEYTEVQVANDGIAIVTNPEVAISCLTVDQLAQLWEPDSTITNYSQLGDDAETGEPLPDVEVSLYGPGTDSGTFDYFTEQIVGEEGAAATTTSRREDDNVLVQGVRADRAGSATSGSPTTSRTQDTLNLVVGRRRRRLRRAERGDDPGRHVHASRTAAVHVPVATEALRTTPGRRLHELRRQQLRHDRRGGADRPDGRRRRPARLGRRSTGRWGASRHAAAAT